jgi:DNA-binding CsgD family transcriptional regulator
LRYKLLSILLLFSFYQYGNSQTEDAAALRDIPLLIHFESSDYDGGIQNWSFDQDSNGILYVANNEGLLEFDGNKWKKFEVPNSTKLRAVKVDSQNRIFVGGQGQIGYFTTTKNGLIFSSLLQQLPPEFQIISETWKIIEHDKKIFFNTESQLFVLDETELRVLELPGYIRQICLVNNRLLVQFYNIGLFEFIDDKFIPIVNTENLPDLISIIQAKDGYYFFSRSGSLYKHNKAGVNTIDLRVNLGIINDVLKLSSGNYAIGTQNNGLFLFDEDFNFMQHLTKNQGLSDRTVKSLYEDEFHNLWLGLNNGIDYLELSLPLSLINEEVGLKGTGYAAVKFKGQMYLGTNNGLFLYNSNNNDIVDPVYELIPGSQGQVYNFSIVGNELFLSHNKGAFQINGDQLKQFHDIGSWKFVQTPIPGVILGGDYQGISFYKKENGNWTKFKTIQDFYESSRMMEFENDSTLWMTHGTKGAYRLLFDDKMNIKSKIELYGKNNGFPSNLFISVYSLNDNLVFTSEKGIYNFNNGSLTFLPNQFFNKWLGKNHVSTLKSNGSNIIYYIQDQKLGLIEQENFGTYRKDTGIFKHVNKYLNDDLPNISILDNHNILIGGKEGFIKYDADKKFTINDDFRVNIRSVKISITNSSNDSSITFYPSFIENIEIAINQSLKFQFAAPFFDGFEDLQYSYRLVPLDENWSKWSSSGEKEYPYLPSGEYTFEVKGLNVYGIESPVVTFPFIVLKPWYLSNLAIVIYLFLGLFFIALLPLIQRKRHRKEKSNINREKEQALKLKNEQIDQIAKESKTEIDKLVNEKLRTELNLKNDQLTTITMQLMNSNEFMMDVRKKINANLIQGSSTQELKEILKTIDDNLSNNDLWEQFAYHFDQVHGDYLKKLSKQNIKLSPREIKLAAFLRMNMSSKEISNLLNITPRSVELARHRLRKKLKLERDQNLVEYLIELDNV